MAISNRGAEAMVTYRRGRSLTQAQAAQQCQVDQMLWSRYERAESTPGLENAHRIEKGTAGEVQAEWFLENVRAARRVA